MSIEEIRRQRGRELKTLRINSGLTQKGLCNISGITTKTISKIENGLVGWSIDNEILFKLSIDSFLNLK